MKWSFDALENQIRYLQAHQIRQERNLVANIPLQALDSKISEKEK